MKFGNVYEDSERAVSYARLQFPGTYFLAFRDLPDLIGSPTADAHALDFGCGAGRSTRFLTGLGFRAIGVDISTEMLAEANRIDPAGDYRLIGDGDLGALRGSDFDLILAAFTFDNIGDAHSKEATLARLTARLRPDGRVVLVVSAPEIYVNEWASFTTSAYPENRTAQSGDEVRIVMTDVPDSRPIIDVLYSDADYRTSFENAGLRVVEVHQPLGHDDEPFEWVSETTTPAWTIYVLDRPQDNG